MTNYDFACCNLINAKFQQDNERKKFKELVYGDKVYCVLIWRSNGMTPLNTLYEYKFKNAMMEGDSNSNHKLRKAIFYLTDKQPYIGFKADIHKSATLITKTIQKRQGKIYIRIYATTKEEAIERAEKEYGKPVRHKLITEIVY